jgi:hypothetical protein
MYGIRNGEAEPVFQSSSAVKSPLSRVRLYRFDDPDPVIREPVVSFGDSNLRQVTRDCSSPKLSSKVLRTFAPAFYRRSSRSDRRGSENHRNSPLQQCVPHPFPPKRAVAVRRHEQQGGDGPASRAHPTRTTTIESTRHPQVNLSPSEAERDRWSPAR